MIKKVAYKGSAGQTGVRGYPGRGQSDRNVKGADAVYNFASIVDLARPRTTP
jgi:hypothetical protein